MRIPVLTSTRLSVFHRVAHRIIRKLGENSGTLRQDSNLRIPPYRVTLVLLSGSVLADFTTRSQGNDQLPTKMPYAYDTYSSKVVSYPMADTGRASHFQAP